MAELRRTFLRGIMNRDADERLLKEGEYRHALNVDVIHSEGEASGTARNKLGNTLVGDLEPVTGFPSAAANARTIGAVRVESLNLIYWLVASDNYDGIYEFSETTGMVTRVLQSNKTNVNTPSQLNFDKDYYVTAINYLDGLILWNDNLNDPRVVNVERAKSYTISDSRIDEDIRLIVAPPLHAPKINLVTEPGQENNIREKFLQFSYRFRYIDNRFSAMAPFSATAFSPEMYEIDYGAGENKAMQNAFNAVDLSFRTGSSFVEEVQLLVRDTQSLNVSIVETFDKIALDIDDDSVHTYRFSNNKIYLTLPNDQLARLYDNVPIRAKSQEIIGRRVVFGNYVQFYDIVDSLGESLDLDYTVSFTSKPVATRNSPENTFRSDRDYEIGIIYGEQFGRFSTVLTSGSNTVYVPANNSVTANSITVDINNNPPAFASHYRLVIKQARKSYFNIFPILYYADGAFRYFLINPSDLDKMRVGDYVIFKSDVNGPTLVNTRYKVLELEAKPDNFILGGGAEFGGLYFKIKVDNISDFNPNALFSFDAQSFGSNVRFPNFEPRQLPVGFRHAVAEKAIHYGNGNPAAMSVVGGNQYNHHQDFRITIEITGPTEFRYTGDVGATTAWVSNIPITFTPQFIGVGTSSQAFQIQFNPSFNLVIGDRWKVNCRSVGHLNGNIFGGVGLPEAGFQIQPGDWGGSAILPGQDWSPTTNPETDRAIETGAVIRIRVVQDSLNPSQQASTQQFPPSPRRFDNIEEWFIETGAYVNFVMFDTNGFNVGAQAVTFRRGSNWHTTSDQLSTGTTITAGQIYQSEVSITPTGTTDLGMTPETLDYPVHMIIQGYGFDSSDDNFIRVDFQIQQSEDVAQCETRPIESDADIFYETIRTYPIVNGRHTVLWGYEDFTTSGGLTNLGQAVPGSSTVGLEPHPFNTGDSVIVNTTNASINGVHTVTDGSDPYNIIIDLPFPGSGPITGGTIGVSHPSHTEQDQTNLLPAKIRLNNPLSSNSDYSAYSFGTGLESDRILDDFNETDLEYSPRASTVIEGYEQQRKQSSLTYSGVFRAESSVNRLNEFNLSSVNFRNLETEFGSIQKLYARDTDLTVFQEDKTSKVLYGKNLLSDSSGGGNVSSIPEVLGTQIANVSEWGISFNPESFAEWGDQIWFTDSKRGAVISMNSSGLRDISKLGMTSHFRELFRNNPNTQKIGVYDPYSHHYILASNEETSSPCSLSINRSESQFPSNTIPDIVLNNVANKPTFVITSNTNWTMAISYNVGTGWVDNFPASGFGDQSVFLAISPNPSTFLRTAVLTITYCNGLTTTHTITQAPGGKMSVITWVIDQNAR